MSPEASNLDTATCWGARSTSGRTKGFPPDLLQNLEKQRNTRCEFQRTVRTREAFVHQGVHPGMPWGHVLTWQFYTCGGTGRKDELEDSSEPGTVDCRTGWTLVPVLPGSRSAAVDIHDPCVFLPRVVGGGLFFWWLGASGCALFWFPRR
ncbi:hypothetical protein M569_17523 [Genlisea aurea]|uniref:Uncharacterized protein n=1 Tax=Genlisea aurea TaxID=192259 RepID=S8BYR1_9LAMI|nr:hypothetical protein M569_17523 [Genlisea aurea]